MYDDVPIVPNLYEAPSNPVLGDCYYNITLDKYYIYDGTQGLEAKIESDSSVQQDIFELTYSLDGGATFTTLQYNDFNVLRTELNSPPINSASYIGIIVLSNPAILIPRTSNLSLEGVALLKLQNVSQPKLIDMFQLKYSKDNGATYTTETYGDFSILEDKMNSTILNGATNIEVSMYQGTDPYGDGDGEEEDNLSDEKDIFYLRYSKDGGQTFVTEEYDNFEKLTDRTNSVEMHDVTDISISMSSGEPVLRKDGIVGKIYPKIIFNQKLVENLVMNTNEVDNNIFDGVLTFYKEKPKKTIYRVSYKDPNTKEGIVNDFLTAHSAITSTYRLIASEFKFEEIEED